MRWKLVDACSAVRYSLSCFMTGSGHIILVVARGPIWMVWVPPELLVVYEPL